MNAYPLIMAMLSMVLMFLFGENHKCEEKAANIWIMILIVTMTISSLLDLAITTLTK